MTTTHFVEKWVDDAASLTSPSRAVWCDGSEAEYHRLVEDMLRDGTLLPLNPRTYPNCYLHRSHPSDVARTEQLTFICPRARDDAGPTNNWMEPQEAKQRVGALFRGSMRGRTMFVIPYLMGPAGSAMSRVGVMVTDSAYVVASMHIMARVGQVALRHMRDAADFVGGLTRSATCRRTGASSCTSPRSGSSGASAPDTAAMRSSARSVTRCGSRPGRRGKKAGWPSTC